MSYKFFQNKSCEYYPCHNVAPEHFNCFGCYCPLYNLGEKCIGNPKFIGKIKDCSDCLFPHQNPDMVIEFLMKNMR